MTILDKIIRLRIHILVLIAILEIVWVYLNISKPQLVCWDESGYLFEGYRIHQAIIEGNWQQFIWLSKTQFFYPFIQSWYLGFTTLPFGYTVNSARLVSLLLLFPTTILIWQIGRLIDKKSYLTAYLAVGLTLTSPVILFFYSTALKESLGLFLTLLCLWTYILARERKSWRFFLLSGFSLLALVFTKYNYGVLVLAAFGIETLIWFFSKRVLPKRFFWLANVMLYLPAAIGLGIWLMPGDNLKFFWWILQNKWETSLYETTILGHLLYYPLELAFGYSFSWLAFVFLVFGFFWALRGWRDYRIRILTILFLINFFLAEKHMINNQGRYIFTVVPAFFLVGSLGVTGLLSRIKKLSSKPILTGLLVPFLVISGLVLARDLISFPSMIKPTGAHETGAAVFYQPDYQNLDRFNFSRHSWPKDPAPTGVEKQEDVLKFIFANVEANKEVQFFGAINEFAPGLFNFYLEKNRKEKVDFSPFKKYQRYIVTLEVDEGSRFDTLDYRRFNLDAARQVKTILKDPGLLVIAARKFAYLGITITILGKP